MTPGQHILEHILVVDDEPGIRALLHRYLSQHGYRVTVAANGEAMLRVLEQGDGETDAAVDLVILDLMMPGEDGLTLTRRLREAFDVAIVILTLKGDMTDRVEGLERGADDYVTKPFNLRELLARVKSVLRRTKNRRGPKSEDGNLGLDGAEIRFAGWCLDLAMRRLTSPDGAEISLSKGEFDLLTAFLRHPGRPLTRDRLLTLARDREWTPFDRSIDVQVGRLRRKIERDPKQPTIIKTVRGAGYLFAAPVERG